MEARGFGAKANGASAIALGSGATAHPIEIARHADHAMTVVAGQIGGDDLPASVTGCATRRGEAGPEPPEGRQADARPQRRKPK